ncbi:hypothetical protein Shyhy02_43340 [Streptomyces hygroscopicus subsp. hygroscopicus]|nr:hypothetical protein Shyhy02_43340 [Streptomyces hygroscopicus subsp. hygroscopicus]
MGRLLSLNARFFSAVGIRISSSAVGSGRGQAVRTGTCDPHAPAAASRSGAPLSTYAGPARGAVYVDAARRYEAAVPAAGPAQVSVGCSTGGAWRVRLPLSRYSCGDIPWTARNRRFK